MTYAKKHFTFSRTNRFWAFFVLFFSVAGVAFAQTYNGNLRGSITDPSGATVAGASITLTDESTQQVRSTTSNTTGAPRHRTTSSSS